MRVSARTSAVASAAASVAVLLAADVAIVVAVWSVALVAWSTLAGMRLARWCGVSDERPLDLVALGYALGLFMTLVVDQIAVSGLGIVWRWTFPVVLTPLALVELLGVVRRRWEARVDPIVPLVVAGGALLAVGHEWLWSLPLGGAALATAWLVHERRSGAWRVVQWAPLVITMAGSLGALVARRGNWWFIQNDVHFFQALATTLGNYGVDGFTLAFGRRLQYHWFPFAWVGAIERLTLAENYVILTRVAPLTAAIGVMLTACSIARRHVPPRALGWFAVAICMSPIFGDWWWGIPLAMSGSFSQFFALQWLAAFGLAMVRWVERSQRRGLLLLGLLAIALVGGKANHAVIAGGAWCTLWIALLIRRDVRASSVFSGGAIVAVSMVVVGRTLVASGQSLQFVPLDWVAYVQGDLYLAPRGVTVAAWVVFMLGMITLPTLILFVPAVRQENTVMTREIGLVSVGLGIALSAFGSRFGQHWGPNGLYFLHSAVFLAMLTGLPAVIATAFIMRPSQLRWALSLAAGTLAITLAIPDLPSGGLTAISLRFLRGGTAILPLLLVGTWALVARRRATAIVPVGALGTVLLCIAVQMAILATQAPSAYRTWATDGVDRPSRSESSSKVVAHWLRSQTPRDAVIATDHLCDVDMCPDPDYSGDAGFAVAAGRRFLVAAPLFSAVYSRPADARMPSIAERIATSIEFGRAPTTELAAALREAGVEWFVAERARSGAVDWATVGDVRYENADYVVIELRDP